MTSAPSQIGCESLPNIHSSIPLNSPLTAALADPFYKQNDSNEAVQNVQQYGTLLIKEPYETSINDNWEDVFFNDLY